MVIRILTGKDVAGAVRYNEQKVELGQAERIQIANYPDREGAHKYAQFRLQLLEQYARLNPGVRKPSVHIAVAFHPTEEVSVDQLKAIGEDVMRDAGFGKQPYLLYQHHDTKHPHIHVVTVAVDGEGNKISDRFIKNRLQKIRRRLEMKYDLVQAEGLAPSQVSNRVGELAGVDPKSNRQTIADALMRTVDTYSFGSVNSLKRYLSTEGITMNTEAGRSQSGIIYQHVKPEGANNRPIKASGLPGRPILTRLTELFLDQADRHKKECEALNTLLQKRLAVYRTLTEADFKQTLRQLNIEVRETDGAYLYLNNRARAVVHEAELERGYGRQELLKRFSNKTERIPVEEVEPVSQKPQNAKSQKPTSVDKVVNDAGKPQAVMPKRLTIAQTENAVIVGNTEKQTHQVELPKEITGSQGIEEHVDGQRKKKQKKSRVRKIHRM